MCQKFHNTSTLGRLFEVQGAAPAELENSDDEEKQLRRVFAKTAAQIDSVIESRNASNVIEEDSSRWGYQTWLNRAGWKRHLKGLDRLSSIPDGTIAGSGYCSIRVAEFPSYCSAEL